MMGDGPAGSVRLPDGSFPTASSCSCARPGPGAKPYVSRSEETQMSGVALPRKMLT